MSYAIWSPVWKNYFIYFHLFSFWNCTIDVSFVHFKWKKRLKRVFFQILLNELWAVNSVGFIKLRPKLHIPIIFLLFFFLTRFDNCCSHICHSQLIDILRISRISYMLNESHADSYNENKRWQAVTIFSISNIWRKISSNLV